MCAISDDEYDRSATGTFSCPGWARPLLPGRCKHGPASLSILVQMDPELRGTLAVDSGGPLDFAAAPNNR
jgi:hypothetical protein